MLIRMILAAAAMAFALPAWASCPLAPGQNMVEVGERRVLVHVGARVKGRAPLVLNLHGSGSRGSEQLASSKLAATADARGFIVAAPDGGIPVERGFVWNIPGVPTITGKVPGLGDADDVAFFGALIDRLVAIGCVDGKRVYSTGLSGGGRMTSWLGCVLSGRIAAIAPVVGLRAGNPDPADKSRPDPKTCAPKRAMPVLAFAGGADNTNPIAGGGAGYWQYSLDAALARWAEIAGCAQKLPTRWVAARVRVEEYGCRGGVEVAGQVDETGGHNWLVADNEAMWRFFSRHRLKR